MISGCQPRILTRSTREAMQWNGPSCQSIKASTPSGATGPKQEEANMTARGIYPPATAPLTAPPPPRSVSPSAHSPTHPQPRTS